jgi:hypothetical protein
MELGLEILTLNFEQDQMDIKIHGQFRNQTFQFEEVKQP